jgi:hypothetical protein
MKSILNLHSVFLLMVLLSCGDDDNANESASLVGKWKVTNFDYIQCTDPANNVQRTCGTAAYCTTWEFTADGNSTIFYTSGATDTSTYTLYPGNTIGLCNSRACSNWIYSVSGNTLTLYTVTPPSSDGCIHKYTFVKA